MNKYVGQSAENIRKLFDKAEKEYKLRGERSGLHIIVFDELDAICRHASLSFMLAPICDSLTIFICETDSAARERMTPEPATRS
jgi:AAA+ superfamily predicted ATPase